MTFLNADGGAILTALVSTIRDNRDYLSEIDGKIGDGDHGINMSKGFTLFGTRIAGKPVSMSEGFHLLGETLLNDIGGSMGPLYGTFFEELSYCSEAVTTIDEATFATMLASAIEAVQDVGSAKRGDKTLLDTLIPAKEAYFAAMEANEPFDKALIALQAAAKTGWQSTEQMMAKVGRASRLGARSIGVLDAGATSCYLILNSIADSILALLA